MGKLRPWLMIVTLLAAGACGGKKDDKKGADKAGDGKGGGDGKGKGGGDGKGDGKADGKGGGIAIKAVQLALGGHGSCARLEDGTVRCWGTSDAGELGGGRVEGWAASAVAVPGIAGATDLVFGGDPGDSGDVGCVIDGNKKTWCWGYQGMIPPPIVPEGGKPGEIASLAGATALALGGGLGLAVFADGTVKGWGGNTFNAMGLGKGVEAKRDELTAIPGIADAAMVTSGQNHGCVAHKDGTASCWGYSSAEINATKVEGVTDVVAITAKSGGSETCALTKAKTVTCWDYDLKAKAVEGLTDVVGLSSQNHSCAVKADGTAWCWGYNTSGQIGNGAPGDSVYKPTQVQGLTDTTSIAAGGQHTCAIHKDGHVSCWGYNQNGQLGDGSLMDRHAPVVALGVNDKTAQPAKDGLGEVQQGATKQSFDGLPEGCTHGGTLDAKFKAFEGPFPVVSANASNDDGKGLTYQVELANHQVDYGKWTKPRGKQMKVNLRFAKIDLRKDKEPQVVVPGVYTMDMDQDQLVYPSVADRTFGSITFGSISLEGMKAGEVELTKVGDGWVCGELRLQTKDARFTGTFAAPLQAK